MSMHKYIKTDRFDEYLKRDKEKNIEEEKK